MRHGAAQNGARQAIVVLRPAVEMPQIGIAVRERVGMRLLLEPGAQALAVIPVACIDRDRTRLVGLGVEKGPESVALLHGISLLEIGEAKPPGESRHVPDGGVAGDQTPARIRSTLLHRNPDEWRCDCRFDVLRFPHCRIKAFLSGSASGRVTKRMDLRWASASCLRMAALRSAALSPTLSAIAGPSSKVSAMLRPSTTDGRDQRPQRQAGENGRAEARGNEAGHAAHPSSGMPGSVNIKALVNPAAVLSDDRRP